MDVRINAIHFEVADRLVDFINKKVERLARRYSSISVVDVNLKVVKPESAMNKEVVLKVSMPQHGETVATKVANTFEEALDVALEAVERQLEKNKDKK
ncbi:MAG: HPF/RaiA family ribosome-associated protein [Muribaculaceae bacterium]|nr:HPF/RaiA family ribosome-associated protein [Muribaculaceae bacterium]